MTGIIFLCTGIFALLGSWGGHWYDVEIQNHGGRSVGYVTGKHFSQPNDWDVDYWFMLPHGQSVNVHWRGISKGLRKSLKIGDPIDIRYELKNITRNFPVNQGNTPIGPVILASVVGLLFTIFGTLLIIGSVKHRG